MKKANSLSKGTILGYGVASASDAAVYNFIIMYILYFLTAVIGLNPVKAGIIISISAICQAIMTLVIGSVSDNSKNRFGRRRPFMVVGGILMFISLILLFHNFDFKGTGQYIYYFIMLIVFWVGYMTFLIPYTALGSEMTLDYDERTKLRTPATIFSCIGNIIGMSLPLTIIAKFTDMGASAEDSWSYFALLLALISVICLFISWMSTRNKELPAEEVFTENTNKNLIKNYWRILKLKPFRWIISFCVLFFFGYMIFQSGLVYYVMYCTDLTEAQMSLALLVNIFIMMGVTVIVSFIARYLDKKTALGLCFFVSATGLVIFYLIGVNSFIMLVGLLIMFSIGNGAYWLLLYPIEYDVAELIEYKYGERKEGSIISLVAFITSIAASIGTQLLTGALTIAGYDPALQAQTAETIHGISTAILCLPAAMFILAGICCILCPLSKGNYEKLMVQLKIKKSGGQVDETGLERLV